jgi:inorganic pyrophosphatase
MRFKKGIILGAICIAFMAINQGCQRAVPGVAEDFRYKNLYTIDSGKNLVKILPALNRNGTVNMVVEIPAGTVAKWEVNGTLENGTKPDDGRLRWEFKNGKPRIIQYLAYPVNYGLIPNTKAADGDPLDIMLLGPAVSRGSVIEAKYIGALLMLDGGEVDDKIVGVTTGSPLYAVNDTDELDERFPGVKRIVETWFANYKGQGKVVHRGWSGRAEAEGLIQAAVHEAGH